MRAAVQPMAEAKPSQLSAKARIEKTRLHPLV
jgi:hypothetical protein